MLLDYNNKECTKQKQICLKIFHIGEMHHSPPTLRPIAKLCLQMVLYENVVEVDSSLKCKFYHYAETLSLPNSMINLTKNLEDIFG